MVFDNDFPGSKELRQPTFLTVIHSTQSSSRRLRLAPVHSYCSLWWSFHISDISNMLGSPLQLRLNLLQWTAWPLSMDSHPVTWRQTSAALHDPSSGSIRLRCNLSHSLDYSFCVLTLRKHLADFTSVTPVSYSSLLILQQQLTNNNAHWRNGFTSLVPVSSKSELTFKPQLPKPQILNSKYHTNSLNRVFEGHSNFLSQLPIIYLHLSQHSYLPRSPTAVH